jgi:hypothetical protein
MDDICKERRSSVKKGDFQQRSRKLSFFVKSRRDKKRRRMKLRERLLRLGAQRFSTVIDCNRKRGDKYLILFLFLLSTILLDFYIQNS